MAKFSGRIRVLLILTFLSKLTFAVPDALTDPSLEIIKQEDAEEGMYPGYNDQDTTTKVQTPLSVELPPKDILEVDTTEVNTPVEEEETDINTQPDEQPLVEEAIPVIKSGYNVQSETKVSDENESEEHEERNDSNLKSDDLVETNNEIYDTGEHIYRKTDNPDQKIVEKNEQQDSSRSEEDATVEEDPTEEYQSENGEILQIEPEEVNLKTEYNENDLDDNNNSLQSLNQQVRPIAQSLIADEDVQTANNHVIENDIKSNEKSENSYETIEKIGYDTKENEIENVHENEEIPEDDTSVEEDMSNDITSLEEDTTENIVEEDVLEEKPFERKNVQEIFESDESASVNNGSDETEPSIPVEDKKIEDNEVNKNEQKLNNEPEEEEWGSPEVKDYQEIVENRENMRPGVVLLGETMPLNEHEISVDELQDAEKDEETENLVEIDYNEHIHGTEEEENKGEDGSQTQEKPVEEEDREEDSETEYGELQKEEEEEENDRTEELQEYNETEDEEGTEEEEETEKDSQTRENYVDAENEFEDDGEEDEDEKENEKVEEEQEEVEPPPAFYEAQNSPFHKMDEEIQPAEEDIDPCLQGPDSGFGKHAHWRFFFNSSVKECQNFLYGGIGGNANKFETLEDCLKACNTRHS